MAKTCRATAGVCARDRQEFARLRGLQRRIGIVELSVSGQPGKFGYAPMSRQVRASCRHIEIGMRGDPGRSIRCGGTEIQHQSQSPAPPAGCASLPAPPCRPEPFELIGADGEVRPQESFAPSDQARGLPGTRPATECFDDTAQRRAGRQKPNRQIQSKRAQRQGVQCRVIDRSPA